MQVAQLEEQRRARAAAAANARARLEFDKEQAALDRDAKLAAAMASGNAEMAKQAKDEYARGIPGVTTTDGKPFLARSEKEAEALRHRFEATHTVTQLIDGMADIIEREGGIEAATKSKEFQQLSSQMGQLVGALKESNQLGALDNGVIKLTEMMQGGASMTGWKSYFHGSAVHGLRELRRGQVSRFNNALRSQDENFVPYMFEDSSKSGQTFDETSAQQVVGEGRSLEGAGTGFAATIGRLGGISVPKDVRRGMPEGIAPQHRQLLDDALARGDEKFLMAAMSQGDPATREAARSRLQTLQASTALPAEPIAGGGSFSARGGGR